MTDEMETMTLTVKSANKLRITQRTIEKKMLGCINLDKTRKHGKI